MRGSWMNKNRECAAYLKKQKAYERCMEELLKKWRSYGKAAGRITLKHASEEERRAIGGIVGRTFCEDTIRFSFAEFGEGLQKTRFAPVEMEKLLEAYTGKTLQTNREMQEERQLKKEDFLRRNQAYFKETEGGDSAAAQWMEWLISEKKYGYSLLMREYGKDPLRAGCLLQNTGKALIKLEEMDASGEELPLAVFAAEISDNPHYFDRGTAAGLLLVHAICSRQDQQLPENAHAWRELLEDVGIIPDNVSSMLRAYGLRLKTETGFHPAYDIFCDRKEPYVITMENLYRVRAAQPIGKQVYVVENEMVFTYLLHHVKRDSYTLLCTSGQLRAAAQKLIGLLIEHGAVIYYSGDLDPDGIGIADRLWQRYGNNICLWRMSPEDYRKAGSDEKIGEAGIAKLRQICHPELRRVAGYMEKLRVAGYQENILPELVEDMEIND